MTAAGPAEIRPDQRAGQSLTIVHLSDLHFGPSSHRFGSQTAAARDRAAAGPSLLDSLKADLAAVLSREPPETSAPVLIAVTGDLTHEAKPDQFHEAARFISDLETFLEDRSARTVIVPGNHDVMWEEPDMDDRLSAWRGFAQNRLHRDVVGLPEHPYALVHTDYATSHGTIVAAINSAAFVEKVKDTKDLNDPKLKQNQGLISPDGIDDLDRQLSFLPRDNSLLRIALVHHHPILIPDLVEPERAYDAILDSGDLLKTLRQYGFHLILHGHKHLPFNFSEDSRAAYSTQQPREQRPILVVAGGSAGSTAIPDNKMQTPTNFYNILRIKWLPSSGECRSRIEPRQLVRFKSGTPLPRGKWHWEPSLPDDRCYEPPPSEPDEVSPGEHTIPFAGSGINDAPRKRTYASNRGAFPVVELRPSLVPSQAHEAQVWIEHHRRDQTPHERRLVKVVWSAGPLHDVTTVSDDPSDRFATVFSYYGPMLVMAELAFADGHQTTQYIYVHLRHGSEQGG